MYSPSISSLVGDVFAVYFSYLLVESQVAKLVTPVLEEDAETYVAQLVEWVSAVGL
jgi:hypothetical protein